MRSIWGRSYRTFYDRKLRILRVTPEDYLGVKHLKDASALLANIRLDWKGLPGTNDPAYFENS